MLGCARREQRAQGTAMSIGWHTENFRRAGKQLRDLDHYLKQFDPNPPDPAEEAAAIFAGFAERGLVRIREVPKGA